MLSSTHVRLAILNPRVQKFSFSSVQMPTHFWSSELQSLLIIKAVQIVSYLERIFVPFL